MGVELAQNCVCRSWYFSGRIDVLDANQPFAAPGSRVEKAGGSRQNGAEVKRAAGRRCETADIGANHELAGQKQPVVVNRR